MYSTLYDEKWREVRETGVFVNLSVSGWRIRLTERLAVVEKRRASARRRSGVWERYVAFPRPRCSEEWEVFALTVKSILSPTLSQSPNVIPAIERGRVRMHRTGIGGAVNRSPGGGKVRGLVPRKLAFGWKPATGKGLL